MNWNLDRKSFHMTYQPAAMQTRTSARERIRVSAAKTKLSSPFKECWSKFELEPSPSMPEHAKPSNTPRAVVSGNGDDLVLDLLVAPRALRFPLRSPPRLSSSRPPQLRGLAVGELSLVFTTTSKISPRLICISC